MPVCIAGMNRSGTSLVTRLLRQCGLYLGEGSDIQKPGADNREGFYENTRFQDLNKAILARSGGAWDFPPSFAEGWELQPEYAPFRGKAEEIAREFKGCEPWGWKDPRNSLTLPFWKRLFPDLKVVVCLRNPLDVARSLYERNHISQPLIFNLWLTYNRSLLAAAHPEQRIITHYDSYFLKPRGELRRLLDFLDFPVPQESLDQASEAVSSSSRHHLATTRDLLEAGASPEVLKLYNDMCAEAGPFYREISADETTADGRPDPISTTQKYSSKESIYSSLENIPHERVKRLCQELESVTDILISELESVLRYKDERISRIEEREREKDAHISRSDATMKRMGQEMLQISNSMKVFKNALPSLEKVIEGLDKESMSSELSAKVGELCINLGLRDKAKIFFEKADVATLQTGRFN